MLIISMFSLLFLSTIHQMVKKRKLQCSCEKVKVLVPQSCLTFCDPMDCSPPGSSVHGILQARILECLLARLKQTNKQKPVPTQTLVLISSILR